MQKRVTIQALPSPGRVLLDNLRTFLNVSFVTYMTAIPAVLPDSLENQILKCVKKLSTKAHIPLMQKHQLKKIFTVKCELFKF